MTYCISKVILCFVIGCFQNKFREIRQIIQSILVAFLQCEDIYSRVQYGPTVASSSDNVKSCRKHEFKRLFLLTHVTERVKNQEM